MATAIIFTDNSDVINAFILASFVIIFPYAFFLSLIAVVKYGKLIGFKDADLRDVYVISSSSATNNRETTGDQ